MNNLIKIISKVFIGFVLVPAILLPIATAYAAAVFNSNPSDFTTFRAANSNKNSGTVNWTTSVSANPGETIAFIISFHNTSNEAAIAAKIRSILPSAAFQTTTIFGEVFAQNAASVSNGVNVSLSSTQTLTFVPGSVKFFTGLPATLTAIPGGQTGDEVVTNNGLNIGNVASDGRGFIVFKAVVGQQQQQGQVPVVATNSATNISQNSVTLNGVVNPNGLATTAQFQYGTNQNSLISATLWQNVGSGSSNINVVDSLLSNLQPNTTYYYRITASNTIGTSNGSILSFTTSAQQQQQGQVPVVATNSATNISQNSATLNGSVNPNNLWTNTWFEYGTNQSLGNTINFQSVGSGNYTQNVIATVSGLTPNTVYYFRAVAQNSYGTNYGNILSFMTNATGIPTYITTTGAPFTTTVPATFIFQNSALFNGTSNPNGTSATAWFEWGLTAALGNTTPNQQMGQGTNSLLYSYALTGLSSNTTYYFRAVAQNSYGTNYGNILSFRTESIKAVLGAFSAPSVYAQSFVVGKESVVTLSPAVDNSEPKAGDTITYILIYRNDGAKPINNVSMKIVLPEEVSYQSSNITSAFVSGNRISFDVGTLNGKSQGIVSIKSKIKNFVNSGDTLVFSANLTYTDSNGKIDSVNAFLTVIVSKSVSVAASLLDVMGWLINDTLFDIFLGLILGYGIYRFFIRSKDTDLAS